MGPKVYIIIPVHNRKVYTERCLKELEPQSYQNHEVIVIDDGSTDGTARMLKEKFPRVTVLQGDGNLWWLGAVNLAVESVMARANDDDAVVLLNNDLTFKPTFIEALVNTHIKHPRALIGSVETRQNDPDIIINGGVRINWWIAKGKGLNSGRSLTEFSAGHMEKTSFLTGRGVLMPLRVFREIGLLDSRYVHMGDFEFSVRAAKNGYGLYRAYDAVVYHYPDDRKGITKTVYKWSDLRAYFTDERSYANLRNIFLNSFLCTKNPLQAISYLVFDMVRITGHFVRGLYFTRENQSQNNG